MRNKKRICLYLFFAASGLFNISGNLFTQEKGQDLVNKLKHTEYTKGEEKGKIVKEIVKEKGKLSNAMKSELIRIFENEFAFREKYFDDLKAKGFSVDKASNQVYKVFHKREHIRYYADFAELISSFKDKRGVPGILKGIRYYGPAIHPGAIALMGDGAAKALLNATKSNDKVLKDMAFFVLSVWVNAPIFAEDYSIPEELRIKDKNLLDKIKASFLEGLHDKTINVRSSAVYGLGAFPENDVVTELEKIRKDDPYFSKYSKKYPIREDAQKAIEKIKPQLQQSRDKYLLQKSTTTQ